MDESIPIQLQLSIKLLNSSNKVEKFGACRELGNVKHRGLEPVWGALMKKNEDSDKDVRREVAIGLGNVSKKGEVKTVRAKIPFLFAREQLSYSTLVLIQSLLILMRQIATLCGMSDDREWSVREAAIKALVQVDSGFKSEPESWKPAVQRVKAVIIRALLDTVEQVRAAAAEVSNSRVLETASKLIGSITSPCCRHFHTAWRSETK